MPGGFDDLLAQNQGGSFDDLVEPSSQQGGSYGFSMLEDKSPYPLPPKMETHELPEGITVEDPYNDAVRKLAGEGVNIFGGLPQYERWKIPFLDEIKQQAFLESRGFKVRRGSDQKLQFWDPKTFRWSPFSPVAGAVVNPADLAGSAIPMALGAGLGIAGEARFGPAGGIAGGAAGSAAGEYVNQLIGRFLGVGEADMGTDWGKVAGAAGEDAAGNVAFGLGTGAFKLGRKLFYPPDMVEKATRIFGEITPDKMELVRSINDSLAGSGRAFKPTLGQVTGDQYLLSLEEQLRDHWKLRVAQSEKLKEDSSALEEYFRAVSDFKAKNPEGFARLKELQDSTEEHYSQLLGAKEDAHEQVLRKAVQQVEDTTPSGNSLALSREIMERAQKEYETLKGQVDAAYAAVDEKIQYDPIAGKSSVQLPVNADLKAHYASLTRSQKEALDESEQRMAKRLGAGKLGEIVKDKTKLKFTVVESPKVEGVDPTITLIPSMGHEDVDLYRLNNTIKFLREDLRQVKAEGGPTAHVLDEHLKTLERFRAETLSETNPGLLKMIEDAEKLRIKQASEFDDTVLDRMFKVDANGKYTLSDPQGFSMLFGSNDPTALKQLMRVTNKDPSAVGVVKDALNSWYNWNVIDKETGLPKLDLHRKFFDENSPDNMLEKFRTVFSDKEMEKVQKLGGLEQVVRRSQRNLEAYKNALNTSWLGKLKGNTNPDNIVRKIMAPTSVSTNDVEEIIPMFRSFGQIENLQQSTADWVKQKITTANGFSMKGLNDLLDPSNQWDAKLAHIMGHDYLNNLRYLRDGLKMKDVLGPEIPGSDPMRITQPGLMSFLRRSIIRPLSREGNISTSFLGIRRKRAQETIAKIVEDPTGQALRDFVRLDKQSADRRKTIRYLGQIGSAGLASDIYDSNE